MLGGVFICYRREDSAGFAGRIYDRLTKRLGRENVFIDVDNIPAGLDFVEVLSERVGRCDALIAVIGRDWLSCTDAENKRRIDNPHDFVRIEIEAALERGIRVIPLLVDGARMPAPEDLPDSLKKLARRQKIDVLHASFNSDVRKLTRALSLFDEELRQRAEAERAALQERERPEATEAAEQARLAAEAQAARQAEEDRQAPEALEAERVAREERERQARAEEAQQKAEAEGARRAEEGRRAGEKAQAVAAKRAEEDRRAEEAVRAERQREELEKRKALEAAEMANRRATLAEAALRAEEDRRPPERAEAEGAVREEREKLDATTAARAIEEHRLTEVPQARHGDAEVATQTKTEAASPVLVGSEEPVTKATPDELYQMGNNYFYGVGREPDAKQALSCYQNAADQGSAEAQFRLGELYEAGLGVVANFGQAKACYQMAAKQGHARAQLRLGELYEVGLRIEMDRSKAKMWYQKAADQGELRARAALIRLQGT